MITKALAAIVACHQPRRKATASRTSNRGWLQLSQSCKELRGQRLLSPRRFRVISQVLIREAVGGN